RQITTADQYAAALESVTLKLKELQQTQAQAAAAGQQAGDLQGQIAATLDKITNRKRTNFPGEFSEGLRTQLQSLVGLFQEVNRSSEITDEKLQQLADFGRDFASQTQQNSLVGMAFS